MPRNGSGIYSLPSGNPVVAGTPIEATWANPTLSDIQAEITGSLPRNGSAPMAANMGMGNYKILNLADGTLATDAATKGQVDAAEAAAVATSAAALSGKQDADPTLMALAGLTLAADKLMYGNGSESAALLDFDVAARTLLTLKKFSGVATFDSRYDEKVNARGSISGAQTLDGSLGTYITATITAATTFTFSNPAASGYLSGFLLELTNGGAGVITWPASVDWPGGTAPTLTASGVDILLFTTRDGGTTWRGSLTQKDSK